MQTNQEPQNKKKIKRILSKFFCLQKKVKNNDLTLEEWQRIEMRKPTYHARSPRELF